MKKKKRIVSLLLAVIIAASLGIGALSVRAEPDDPSEAPVTEQSLESSEEISTAEESSETETDEPETPDEPDDPQQSSDPDVQESSNEEYDPDPQESSQEEYESEPEYSFEEESSEYEYSEESSESEVTEISTIQSESSVWENSPHSGYEYSDNSELTPEDWEQQKSQISVQEEQKKRSGSGSGEFDSIKNDSNSADEKNDDWIYLAWGIVLISIGVLAITAVIITSIYSKKKLKKQHSADNKKNNKNSVPAKKETYNGAKETEQPQSESKADAKRNTMEIDINELRETLDKDDYNDSFDDK